MDVHAIVARALREDVKDPRVADLSITAVRMSRDLSIAHVNVVPLGGRGDTQRLMQGLDAAAGFLRSVLGQQIRLRHTPQLQFHLDDGLDDSLAMTRRLSEMEQDRADQDLPMAAEGDDQDLP
ncbi:MAG: 30S ribosome-binding factor RbfA [Oligoflexia bacterium]|nr:30S ribosome-binding factor RbfA [Oligoflexia bacterium]